MSKQLSLSAHISVSLMALLALAVTVGGGTIDETVSKPGEHPIAAFRIMQ